MLDSLPPGGKQPIMDSLGSRSPLCGALHTNPAHSEAARKENNPDRFSWFEPGFCFSVSVLAWLKYAEPGDASSVFCSLLGSAQTGL